MKRVLTILMSLALLFNLAPVYYVFAQSDYTVTGDDDLEDNIVGSGNLSSYGEVSAIRYVVYKDGTCVISGTGDMPDFGYFSNKGWDGAVMGEVSPFFDYKDVITRVVREEGVTGIGVSSFLHCSKLQEITVPKSLKRIGDSAFDYTGWYKKQPKGLLYIGHVLYGYKGKCPANVKVRKGTVSISDYAFSGSKSIRKVSIPGSVAVIGESVFSNSGLNEARISNGVREIGAFAFSGCSGLKKITLPASIKEIGMYAFSETRLKKVTLRNKKIKLGAYAFAGTPISKNTMNTTLYVQKMLADYNRTSKAKSYKVRKGTITIASHVFSESKLQSLYIPASTRSIGKRLFENCNRIKTIKVSRKNKIYDSRNNCNAVIEKKTNMLIVGCGKTVIPASVNGIGETAFYAVKNLRKIRIPGNVSVIGKWAFCECSNLTDVTISDGVEMIEQGAFQDCGKLKSITVPESVKAIGSHALGYTQSAINFSFTKIKGFKIKGEKGSAAEEYAKENGFAFVHLD